MSDKVIPMYFFYIDESGSRDTQVAVARKDGTIEQRDSLYVLTAVGLYERKRHPFDREIANLKLELSDHIYRRLGIRYTLAECEVKSTTLRIPKRREAESPFLHTLAAGDLKRITDTYYQQIAAQKRSASNATFGNATPITRAWSSWTTPSGSSTTRSR